MWILSCIRNVWVRMRDPPTNLHAPHTYSPAATHHHNVCPAWITRRYGEMPLDELMLFNYLLTAKLIPRENVASYHNTPNASGRKTVNQKWHLSLLFMQSITHTIINLRSMTQVPSATKRWRERKNKEKTHTHTQTPNWLGVCVRGLADARLCCVCVRHLFEENVNVLVGGVSERL